MDTIMYRQRPSRKKREERKEIMQSYVSRTRRALCIARFVTAGRQVGFVLPVDSGDKIEFATTYVLPRSYAKLFKVLVRLSRRNCCCFLATLV